MHIILASGSPRRKELLEWLELDFEVVPSDFSEEFEDGDDIEEVVEELALQKALTISRLHPDDLVIGADTMVSVDGRPIGKADDATHAKEILRQLSGTRHQITTGVALIDPVDTQTTVFHDTSFIQFRELTDKEIEEYLESDIWHDKAGAYAVQEDEGKFVREYEGSFTNIMGLPLIRLAEELSACGIEIGVDVTATIEANTCRRER